MPVERYQIFYDRLRFRWRYARRIFLFSSLFLAVIFGVTISGILHRPDLPELPILSPSFALRDAPDAPRVVPSQQPASSNRSATLAKLRAAKERSQLEDSSYAPKALAFFVNWDDNSLVSLKAHIDTLDMLLPEWLHLVSADGTIVVDDPVRQTETLEFVRGTRSDLPVMPLVNNFDSTTQDWDGVTLGRMLSDPPARSANIRALLDFIRIGGFAGINIDYENVPEDRQADLVSYMRELYTVFHPLGLIVSQDIPIDDDSYDALSLSASVDFLVLMAYDENSAFDTSPGPVAGQEWFTDTLALRFSSLPPEKTVVALGSYGYEWDRDEAVSGTTVTYQEALQTARAAKADLEFETESLNPTFDYYDHEALRSVWYLDAATFYNQVSTSLRLGNPYGFALWRMGSEDPDVWTVLSARGELGNDVIQSLETMEYGYDISYLGQGEVLRVSTEPVAGRREFEYDETERLITDERITVMPSGYVIDRWGGDDPKKIALTFDDGPDAEYTTQILDVLSRYGVPATFFVIGQNASVRPDILWNILQQGSEIGSHTYTHPNVTTISDRQFSLELNANQRMFEGVLGKKTLLFRPPYAEDIEPATPEQVRPLVTAAESGYYTVAMHIDPKDWESPGVSAIVSRVIEGVKSGQGNVVLLHDGGGNRSQTVAALPGIIEGLQSGGYRIVTVSDLMNLPPESVMPPVVWTKQISAIIYATAFYVISAFNNALAWLFVAGIVLGIVRFFFISTLAILQFWHVRRLDRGRLRGQKKPYQPHVSVIVPAYNEEKVIRRTVDAILDSRYPSFDVIIVNDGSTDWTSVSAQAAYGGNSSVRVFSQENLGKAAALNFGLRETDAEIVITLDADTLFRPDTITRLVEKFDDDARVAAVAGNAKVGNRTNILTKWQALEYITSQNLDRRAFEVMNCITVVPGSVGAWRREAVIGVGGFSSDTLAEDADLTFALLRAGHRVAYADRAIGSTEAPDTVRNFIRQRFRWMYGTFQTVWKYRFMFLRPRYRALGMFAMPNVLVFQIFFPLISPVMDLLLVLSLLWAWWQSSVHPLEVSTIFTLRRIFEYYILFLLVDFMTAVVPLLLEKGEQWRLLLWLPLQRFFYRQLMYYVAIKSVLAAIQGKLVGWGKFGRSATVQS